MNRVALIAFADNIRLGMRGAVSASFLQENGEGPGVS